ncbi:UDP-glucuronosyltransferase 2C1-like [Asterias amurensis]|uniref:UDP-glucuronosyltransferase 2C1-like n=1 Tax=Asterias amurensis TaxID=7602 RepID=UPI003AB32634
MAALSSLLSKMALFAIAMFCFPYSTEASNILFISGLGGPGSHFYTGSIIAETLVKRGHSVTFLISDVFGHRTNSSLADIFTFETFSSTVSVSDMQKGLAAFGSSSVKGELTGTWGWLKLWLLNTAGTDGAKSLSVNSYFAAECNATLSDDALMGRLRNAHFDIIVGDVMYPCYILIAQKLNLRYVNVMNGLIMPMAHGRLAGLPSNPAFIPEMTTQYTDKMNIYERFVNVIAYGVSSLLYDHTILAPFESLKRLHGIQPETSVFRSFGLAEIWLMNSDFSADFPRSLTPNVILVGGLTTSPGEPLDPELEDFMNGSGEHGVVVFTVSSYFNAMNATKCASLAATLARLPQRVVWKFEGEPPATVGNNTKLVKWLPQNDLLAHPKTRALITHAGLNGVFEAIYHGVPIVGLPMVGDQFDILVRIEARKLGKGVDITTITEDIFHEAIVEVLEDKRYKANAEKWSRIFKDQPSTPRDRAADWVEVSIKYGGAHLRPKSLDLNFFQLNSIDVIAFLCIALLILVCMVFFLMRAMCRFMCCRNKTGKLKSE